MRKAVRNQILDLLATMWEGVKQAKALAPQAAQSVLTDCYLAVQAVGQALQSGLSAQAFARYSDAIEEIKLLVEQIHSGILQTLPVSEPANRLKGKLRQIRALLEREAEVRLEIVFMPYKASMWDALESVYFAARQDARCETFVVPLPYYERTPDFQLGALHYEGAQFPPQIPITHYEQYDVKTRRPDVIYIHCAYDNCNYVTSVDPRFYSSELKKYTDMLVYIPYFVSGETVTPSFCRIPGVTNAHRVIVQSQSIREQYSQYANLPLSHFAALGSPKFDRVIQAQKKDFPLPDEWRERIGKRKVVLYNTGLSNIIGNCDLVAEKLQYVFSCFQDRDDVVLWWRPHPLSRSTASSMRPAFYARYCALEDAFRQSGTGIFDDTPDLQRAIAYSDAYYGDHSSLLPLYEAAGKPALLADIDIRRERSIYGFQFNDCAATDGLLYFSEENFNGLFCRDLQTGEISFLGRFPGEDETGRELYKGVALVDGKLFFAPSLAREIAVYDIARKAFDKIPLPPVDVICEGAKFLSCVVFGHAVFMVGCTCAAVLKIDAQTLKASCYTDWYTKNKSVFRTSPQDVLFRHDAAVAGHCFAIPSCTCNRVLEFDMDACKGKLLPVGGEQNRYGSICYDGVDFWLSPRFTGPIVRWNRQKGTVREYPDLPGAAGKGFSAVSSAAYEGRVGFYFLKPPFFIEYDLDAQEFKAASACCTGGFLFARKAGGMIYALAKTDAGNQLVEYDTKTGRIRQSSLSMPKEWRACARSAEQAYIKGVLGRPVKRPQSEYLDIRLEGFLDALVSMPRQSGDFAPLENLDGRCGQRIHEYILGLGTKQ